MTLLRVQGKDEESLSWNDRLIACHRQAGRAHQAGRALVQKCMTLYWLERYIETLTAGEEATTLLDVERERTAQLSLLCIKGAALIELRRYGEARAAAAELRQLLGANPEERLLLACVWLEGLIEANQNPSPSAEETLRNVRQRYLEGSFCYDAALVTLDLAELHLRLGRTEALDQLAQEMLPILKGGEVHAEAGRALQLFQRAVFRGEITQPLIQKLYRYLLRARGNPTLAFALPPPASKRRRGR